MQAFLSSSDNAPDLDSLNAYHNKVFSQFIDSTVSRLEGHITSDKIVYKQGDTVFVDLLVLDALTLSPHTNAGSSYVVSLYDDAGVAVQGLAVTLQTAGPTYGLTLRLPSDIEAGNYLIVAESSQMATATRTIVVQALPVAPTVPVVTGDFSSTWSVFDEEVLQSQPWGLAGKVQIVRNADGTPFSNAVVKFEYYLDGTKFDESPAFADRFGFAYFHFSYSGLTVNANSDFSVVVTSAAAPTLNE